MNKSIINELETVRKKHGGVLHPRHVVRYAKNENTSLHSHFEWDDTVASQKYREDQAARLIRVCVIHLPGREDGVVDRAYVSLLDDRQSKGGYRHIVDVVSDDDLKRKLLEAAKADLISFQKRYDQFQELALVFDAIKKVV